MAWKCLQAFCLVIQKQNIANNKKFLGFSGIFLLVKTRLHIFENIHAEYTFICSIELSALFDKPRSSSSAEEIVRAMAPKASSNTIVRAIGPSHTSGNKMGPNQIGHNEMGPSDTINDIAALAALSDLDQDERIEKVKKYSILCMCSSCLDWLPEEKLNANFELLTLNGILVSNHWSTLN